MTNLTLDGTVGDRTTLCDKRSSDFLAFQVQRSASYDISLDHMDNINHINYHSGVSALSKAEIRKDVREMEQMVNSDTDTDSSIISEEVLVSSYPVKPRKTPKGPGSVQRALQVPLEAIVEKEIDGKTIEMTLAFIDTVKRSKDELYNAECQREFYENQSTVSPFADLHVHYV